ncbi:MAG: SPFH domain-containing protein [Candidatus Promineifilaceae bacterium]
MRLFRQPAPSPRLLGFNKNLSLLGLTLLFFGYWYIAFLLERVDYSQSAVPVLVAFRSMLSLFGPLSSIILLPLFNAFIEFFSPRVLRHLIPPLVGWWLARWAILGLLQSFYDLPDADSATSLLYRLSVSRVNFLKPAVIKLESFEADRKKNSLLKIGGPGRVKISGGAALVTELNGSFYRVRGPGQHTLERFEYPRTLVDLRPQERESENIRMMTSDGIELTTSLTVTFQIDRGDNKPTPEKPFPFLEEAVRIAAYAETNQAEGQVGRWDALPLIITAGQLRAVVGEYRLDELILSEPNGIDIHRRLQMAMERRAKTILHNFGIVIRGTRLGALKLDEVVENQRTEYWKAHWNTQRTLQLADGEVEILQSQEIARAEAEAIMLKAIAEGLQRSRRAGRDVSSREVVALRLIESLEAMAQHSGQVVPLPGQLMPHLGSLRQQLMLTSGTPEETANQE